MSKIQERNLNFLKNQYIDELLEESQQFSISLRKKKRLEHISNKRFSTNESTAPTDVFTSQVLSAKTVIEASFCYKELSENLNFISEKISKFSEKFPFEEFFSEKTVNIFKEYLIQNENISIKHIVLNILINTFAKNEIVSQSFIKADIVDILITITRVNKEISLINNAILALGNLHDCKSENTNYWIASKFWKDLLNLLLMKNSELAANAIWCLMFLYKSPVNPSEEVDKQIFDSISPFIRSRDCEVLKETLKLANFMTKNVYTVHIFVRRDYLRDLLTYISYPNLEIVKASYSIILNIIQQNKGYIKVMLDMGFGSRISVSLGNRSNQYQDIALNVYSTMLSRGEIIALKLLKDTSFEKFYASFNSSPKARSEVIKGVLHLAKYMDFEINKKLLSIDILRAIIEANITDCDNDILLALQVFFKIFDFFSNIQTNDYSELCLYFNKLGGCDYLENLRYHKNTLIQDDSKNFLKVFYDNDSDVGLNIESSTFNF